MAVGVDLTANAQGFKSGVSTCQQSLSELGRTLEKTFDKVNGGFQGWGLNLDKLYDKGNSIFKGFGVDIDQFAAHFGMSGKVIAGITAATVALTKFGQEMHGAMAEIAKGTGAVGEQLLAMQENVKSAMIDGVARPVAEIGTMVADLNTRFGSTGEQLTQLTAQFDDFAEVTGTDTHEAINGVADVIEKWGMSVDDVNPLLDQLTKAGQDSGASVQSLMQNLKQSRTVFSQFGMSATRSIAFLETLAKAGIDTGTAMQGMKIALANFAAQGRNAQEAFKEVGNAIRDASSDSEALNIAIETFGARAGPEMINVFRNGATSVEEFEQALLSAGGAVEETDKAARTSQDAIEELVSALKGTFAGFGEGFDYLVRDIIDSVTSLVRWISPAVKPIADIFRDVFAAVGSVIKTVVEAFVEFQTRYNVVFQNLVNTLNNVYTTFHRILKNIEGIFTDVFGFIFALLDKNWGLAWEYAKNALLKFADSVLAVFDFMLEGMKPMINGIIGFVNKIIDGYNVVAKLTHLPLGENIKELENIDLADSLGITKMIAESDRKISELTGKAQKKLIGALGEVKDVSTDIMASAAAGAQAVGDTISQWESKIAQQQLDRLNREKQNAVTRAQNEGKSEEEIFRIKEEYDYKIRALQEAQIEREKKAALEKARSAEEAAKIEIYYSNEIAKLFEENEERKQKAQEASSQWDSKLLAQKISLLEQEEKLSADAAEKEKASEEEIYSLRQNFGEQIIELKKQQLEMQRAADLEAVKGAEEIAKVNLYYDNEITSMVREENAKRAQSVKETGEKEVAVHSDVFSRISGLAKKFSSTVSNVFKGVSAAFGKVMGGIKTAVTKVFSSLTSSFKAAKGIFTKLFDLDVTESLTSLLEYEDKILTFFTFTLPKLPGYVESAVSSVSVLMGKLFEQIDFGQLEDMVNNIIHTLTSQAPKIVAQIAELFTGIVRAVGNAVKDNAGEVAGALGSMLMSMMDRLPEILQALSSSFLSFLKGLGDAINENAGQIAQDLSDMVAGMVNSLVDFLQSGGWKSLLDAVLNVIKAANKAIMDNFPVIVDTIIDMLPDLVDTIIETVIDANKTMARIAKPLAKLLVNAVSAFIDLLTNEDMILSAIDVLVAVIEAIITEILPRLPELIIKLIFGLINAFVKSVPQLVSGIVTGLIKGFAETNWLKVVKDIFTGFINGIKKLFGIHSPSKLFTEFGGYMVQGLVNGLKNIWGSVSGIFSSLAGSVGNALGNIKNTVSSWVGNVGNMMSGAFDTVRDWASNIGSMISNAASSIASGVSNVASNIGSGVSSAVSNISSGLSNFASGVSNAVSGAIDGVKNFFGFATGTQQTPSGLALVGERGPELVDFRGGERVFNADNTRKILSGESRGGNVFTMNFYNTSQTTAYTMMRQMRQYGRELAFNGVL